LTGAQNYTFAKIQDGGSRHPEVGFFGHISAANEDICVKFGM